MVIWAKTYEGFQRAEELRDALEASWAKQFVFCKTSTDGEVPQPQQLDVWMVGVVTLVEKQSSVGQLVGFHQLPIVWFGLVGPMNECYGRFEWVCHWSVVELLFAY